MVIKLSSKPIRTIEYIVVSSIVDVGHHFLTLNLFTCFLMIQNGSTKIKDDVVAKRMDKIFQIA